MTDPIIKNISNMKENIRQKIEMLVTAHNFHLRQRVKSMSDLILLRNVHPIYRSDLAHKLYQAGEISILEAQEFTRILLHG